jgi:uncharacterized repeat protein (TIGR01451 family)
MIVIRRFGARFIRAAILSLLLIAPGGSAQNKADVMRLKQGSTRATTNILVAQPTSNQEKCAAQTLSRKLGANRMPDVAGCSYDNITLEFLRHKRFPNPDYKWDAAPLGQIFDQEPKSETILTPDTKIMLSVSRGPTPVPNPPPPDPNIPPDADISVVTTLETKGPYLIGQTVQFTSEVSNLGLLTAEMVPVYDLPTNMRNYEVSGACSSITECTIPSIAPNTPPVIIKATGVIASEGTFDNTVRVVYAGDRNGANDSATSGGRTTPTANLSVTQTLVDAEIYRPNQPVQYKIVIRNEGPSIANNIHVEISSTNLAALNVSGECSSATCTITSLAPNKSAAINVDATIVDEAKFINTAKVTADENDPDLGNNSLTIEHPVTILQVYKFPPDWLIPWLWIAAAITATLTLAAGTAAGVHAARVSKWKRLVDTEISIDRIDPPSGNPLSVEHPPIGIYVSFKLGDSEVGRIAEIRAWPSKRH